MILFSKCAPSSNVLLAPGPAQPPALRGAGNHRLGGAVTEADKYD